jgi:hypothetical protein
MGNRHRVHGRTWDTVPAQVVAAILAASRSNFAGTRPHTSAFVTGANRRSEVSTAYERRLTEIRFKVTYRAGHMWAPPRSEVRTMDLRQKASPELIKDYMRLFINRRAYTFQSMRPHPETGRHYYFRPREKGTIAPHRGHNPRAPGRGNHHWALCHQPIDSTLQMGGH